MTEGPVTGPAGPRPGPEARGSRSGSDVPAAPASEAAGEPRKPVSEADRAQVPADSSPAASTAVDEDLLARTKVSQMWIGIIVFAIILILLLIFVLENTKKVPVTYFGFTGSLPLAVAMLLSAVAGILLTAIAGTLRILQLRKRVRKASAAE
jgi:putative membrane protein